MKLAEIRGSILALTFCLTPFLFGSTSSGALSTVRTVNGAESDLVAEGDLFTHAGGEQIGTWSLQASVASTDFSNETVFGGSQGVQYTMLNAVFGSTDTNEIVFSVADFDELLPQITLRQSPYFQDPDQWNGGNEPTDIAQFTVSWEGGGTGVVRDPLGQFQTVSTQSTTSEMQFASGTTFTFSDFQILNSEDAWEIELPLGVDSVNVDWSSSAPTAGSDLTREWIAFDGQLVVPEAAAGSMFVLGVLLLGLAIRRFSRTTG